MNRNFKMKKRVVFAFTAIVLLAIFLTALTEQEDRISAFGVYRGYSEPIYDGWMRFAQYVPVRDGTKIAIDIFRPTLNGELVEDPLPVIWTHSRYHRASIIDGKLRTMFEWLGRRLNLPWILSHGYVVAAVDTRGGGASFGSRRGFFAPEEAQDAYDITEWLAEQPWSDGNIGMYGRSYLGITQYFAASQAPPHLKTIFPEMAFFDAYDFLYPGGVFRNDFAEKWSHLTKTLDASLEAKWYEMTIGPVAPVDADADGTMLAEALKEHEASWDIFQLFSGLPFRNSRDEISQQMIYPERSPATYLDKIKKSGVAIYHYCGWFDMFPRDALLFYRNLNNPQKLAMGAWFHAETFNFDHPTELLRWFDYWLKGIDNGIMDEPPIHYWVMGAPEGHEWRAAWEWPLPNEMREDFFFTSGPSSSINSVNDGLLISEKPNETGDQDKYAVDYTTSPGKGNRWANGYAGPKGYPDLAPNDAKGLTYTTAPLEKNIEVTGHPVVHLWISSTANDGDFFAYLEEIDASGKSLYVTEGTLRASFRAVDVPLYDYFGLPWHRCYEEDATPLPQEPVELPFDLHPTSNIFDAGNRIRIKITCADKDSTLTPEVSPPPVITVFHSPEYPSRITLPIIPADQKKVPTSLIIILCIILIVVVIAVVALIKKSRKTGVDKG